MGSKPAPAGYRELGAALRKLRKEAGLTGRQAAFRSGWDPTKISRIESGQVHLDVAGVCWYLGKIQAPHDEAVPLINLCRQARHNPGFWLTPLGERIPDAFSSLLYHESTAAQSINYESQVIPGLLQTERYANALIGGNISYTKDDVEVSVQMRMNRHWVLDRRGSFYDFYIHEQALRTVFGGAAIMCEQLLALTFIADSANVTVRVVPGSLGDFPALLSPFQVYEFEEHNPIVHLDNVVVASLWFEERDFVDPYCRLTRHLADVASSVEESRAFIAALADEYDRGSSTHGLHPVAQEHLQR